MSALVGHAGGFGWDELLIFALPVVVLGVLQLAGRRKKDRPDPDPDAGDEGKGRQRGASGRSPGRGKGAAAGDEGG